LTNVFAPDRRTSPLAGKLYGEVTIFCKHERISGKGAQEPARFPVKQPGSIREAPAYCGIPVASIFVPTDQEAGRDSSAVRTATPRALQGPWPERWSGWKVLTADDPTFSIRFT
jgi:hypothetical protein